MRRVRGLTEVDQAILKELDRQSPQYPTQLAEKLGPEISAEKVAAHLKRLEEDGLVESRLERGKRLYAPVIMEVKLALQAEIIQEIAKAESLSEADVVEAVNAPREEVVRALPHLAKGDWIRAEKTAGERSWTFEQTIAQSFKPRRVEAKILKALAAAKPNPLSTAELVEETALARSLVYAACKRLQEYHQIKVKKRQRETPMYFFPVTGEVMHGGNYERIQEILGRLRKILESHKVDDPKLLRELLAFLETLARRPGLTKFADRIQEFEEELRSVVHQAEKKSDVSALLGLKPYFPKEQVWSL